MKNSYAIIAMVVVAIIAGGGVYGVMASISSTVTSTLTSTVTSTSLSTSTPSPTTSTTSQVTTTKIVFGLSVTSYEYLPEYAALAGGFWSRLGLDVTLQPFQGDGPQMQAAASGQINVGEASYGGELLAESHGIGIKVVSVAMPEPDMVVIVAKNSSYTNPNQLSGATVATTSSGSVTDIMFHIFAAHFNYTIGKNIYEITPGYSGQLAALEAGKVQAIVDAYDTAYALEAAGAGRILYNMSAIVPQWLENAVYASNSLISSNPSAIQNLLQGMYNAEAYIRSNNTWGVQVAMQYLHLNSTVAQEDVSALLSPGILSSNGLFTTQVINGMSYERSQMLALNVSSTLIPANQSYVTQFVPITVQNQEPLSFVPS
ncbi:MAG: ABC transporter substrate-binding protein [Nitrososphaerota archaeon]|nr:ABC transporter substrate-binding protein [Nitrososphaerota archaeon]